MRTHISTGVNLDEVRRVLDNALRHELDLAGARRTYFERTCRAFEQQHQMSSEEFMRQFESGTLGDAADLPFQTIVTMTEEHRPETGFFPENLVSLASSPPDCRSATKVDKTSSDWHVRLHLWLPLCLPPISTPPTP